MASHKVKNIKLRIMFVTNFQNSCLEQHILNLMNFILQFDSFNRNCTSKRPLSIVVGPNIIKMDPWVCTNLK